MASGILAIEVGADHHDVIGREQRFGAETPILLPIILVAVEVVGVQAGIEPDLRRLRIPGAGGLSNDEREPERRQAAKHQDRHADY